MYDSCCIWGLLGCFGTHGIGLDWDLHGKGQGRDTHRPRGLVLILDGAAALLGRCSERRERERRAGEWVVARTEWQEYHKILS